MIRKLLVGMVLCLCVITAKAQLPALTFGEAYNWQVGDTFIYQPFYWNWFFDPYQFGDTIPTDPVRFTVTSKADNGDSIVYTIRYFNDSISLITIRALDSPVLNLGAFPQFGADTGCFVVDLPGDSFSDMPYYMYGYEMPEESISESTFYGRKSTQVSGFPIAPSGIGEWLYGVAYWSGSIVSGIGMLNYYASVNTSPNNSGGDEIYGCGYNLAYYSSGTFTYSNINQVSPSRPKPKIFPNPSTGAISIIPAAGQTDVIETVLVCDMLYRPVAIKETEGYKAAISVDISNASNGLYLVVLLDKSGLVLSRQQIVKE